MYDFEIYVTPEGLEYWYEVIPGRCIDYGDHSMTREFWLIRKTWEVIDWE